MPGRVYNLLREHAAEQCGYITTRDAENLGVDPHRLQKMKDRGVLTRVSRGIFRFDEVPASALALAALHRGDAERARDGFVHELQLAARQSIPQLVHEPLSGLAAVAAAQGRDELAAMLSGAADAASPDRHDPVIARRLDECFFGPARARVGEHGLRARRHSRPRPGRQHRAANRPAARRCVNARAARSCLRRAPRHCTVGAERLSSGAWRPGVPY